MEKKVTEQSIFEEKTLVIEVVGDIAILREARVGLPPKVVCSGTKDIVAAQVATILRWLMSGARPCVAFLLSTIVEYIAQLVDVPLKLKIIVIWI